MAKINWSKALQDYITDETLSYKDIAVKYGIGERAVSQRGSDEDWPELRKITAEKVRQNLPEKTGDKLAEVNARHINIAKILQQKGLLKLQDQTFLPRSFRDARESVSDGVSIERKAYGLDNPKNFQQNNFFISPDDHFQKVKDAVEGNI